MVLLRVPADRLPKGGARCEKGCKSLTFGLQAPDWILSSLTSNQVMQGWRDSFFKIFLNRLNGFGKAYLQLFGQARLQAVPRKQAESSSSCEDPNV
jgi:hypothetical protein